MHARIHTHIHTHTLSMFLSFCLSLVLSLVHSIIPKQSREGFGGSEGFRGVWPWFNIQNCRINLSIMYWLVLIFCIYVGFHTLCHDHAVSLDCHFLHSDAENNKIVVFTCFPVSAWRNACFSRFCFPHKKRWPKICTTKWSVEQMLFFKENPGFLSWHPTNQPLMYVRIKTISVPLDTYIHQKYNENKKLCVYFVLFLFYLSTCVCLWVQGPLRECPRAGRFRGPLLLHTTCVRSWCNWRASHSVWWHNIQQTNHRNKLTHT